MILGPDIARPMFETEGPCGDLGKSGDVRSEDRSMSANLIDKTSEYGRQDASTSCFATEITIDTTSLAHLQLTTAVAAANLQLTTESTTTTCCPAVPPVVPGTCSTASPGTTSATACPGTNPAAATAVSPWPSAACRGRGRSGAQLAPRRTRSSGALWRRAWDQEA